MTSLGALKDGDELLDILDIIDGWLATLAR